MTVQSATSRADYDGNGVTVDFPVPFRFLDKTHLRVIRSVIATGVETELVLDSGGATGYTVTGAGAASGGEVTVVTAPVGAGATQERITILRNVPATQLLDFIANDAFPAESHERGLDQLTMLHGQQGEVLDRAMVLPATTTGFSSQLPAPVALAPLVVNAAATGFEMGSTTLTGDLLLRGELASATSGKGSDLVSVPDELAATPYLKTLSDMLNGLPIPITRWIDPTELAAIRDGSSTYDAATDLNDALAEYYNFVIPAGRYAHSSTLLLRDRATLRGDGWSVPFNGGSVQEPRGSVFRLLPGANCDSFRQASKGYRHSIHLSGFAIDGDGANQSSNVGPDGTYGMYQFNRNAFFFEALYNAIFQDLFVYNMRGAGWALHGDGSIGMTNVFLRDCHAYNCRTYSIYTEGSLTDLRINGGDYGFGRVANLRLTSSATVNDAVFWTSQCQDITDAATHATGTGAVVNAGIIIAGSNNKIAGCRSEGNSGHGIKASSATSNNKVSNCSLYFNSSSAATSGLFDGVNDAGDDNTWEDLDIRQSASSPHALRKAIRLEAGHSNTSILGGRIRRVGANAALVTLPVEGFSHALGDKSDYSWANGEVKAHATVANSISTSATVVNFDTETADTRGEFAADVFTAAEAGVYRIDTGVNIANVTDGNSFIVAIYKNGVEYRRLGQQRAGAGAAIQICGSLEMKLEAGDTIDVRGTCGTANNTNVGAALTWIEVTQING
jgi:hypothetical protein